MRTRLRRLRARRTFSPASELDADDLVDVLGQVEDSLPPRLVLCTSGPPATCSRTTWAAAASSRAAASSSPAASLRVWGASEVEQRSAGMKLKYCSECTRSRSKRGGRRVGAKTRGTDSGVAHVSKIVLW